MTQPIAPTNNAREAAPASCLNSRASRITLVVISIIALSCAVTAFVLAGHLNFTSPLFTNILICTGTGFIAVSAILPIFMAIANLNRRVVEDRPENAPAREEERPQWATQAELIELRESVRELTEHLNQARLAQVAQTEQIAQLRTAMIQPIGDLRQSLTSLLRQTSNQQGSALTELRNDLMLECGRREAEAAVLRQGILQLERNFVDNRINPIVAVGEEEYKYEEATRSVAVKVNQTDVKNNPETHLNHLTIPLLIQMEQCANLELKVTFHVRMVENTDGFTKIYLDDLISALVSKPNLFTINRNSLYGMPKSKTETEKTIFFQLGQLMMLCYPNLPIGRHIDPLVFQIAFSMTAEEIDGVLPQPKKRDLFKSIVESQIDPELMGPNSLDLLGKKLDLWTEEDCMNAAYAATTELPNDYHEGQSLIREVVIDRKNREKVLEALWKFYEDRLGPQLNAICQIASGMKAACAKGSSEAYNPETQNTKWDEDFCLDGTTTAKIFSKTLQGITKREAIVQRIKNTGGNPELLKKIRWLREWILGTTTHGAPITATDGELKAFLKFVTGSTGLPPDKRIIVISTSPNNPSPYPITHTCFNTIEIADHPTSNQRDKDDSKAAFIQCLRHAIVSSGGRL